MPSSWQLGRQVVTRDQPEGTVIIDAFSLPVARTLAVACGLALMALPTLFAWIPARRWIFASIVFVALTILMGMGLGSRLIVSRGGIVVTMTFLGIPYRRDLYSLRSILTVERYQRDGAPSGVAIVDPHAHRECTVGSQLTAESLLAAIQAAVARWGSEEKTG
jgi:hypothetical protein